MNKCESCDIDLGSNYVVVFDRAFCCAGCSEGGPCVCSYEQEDGRRQRNGHSDPVISEILYLESNERFSASPDAPRSN